jgi:hypothetical protein
MHTKNHEWFYPQMTQIKRIKTDPNFNLHHLYHLWIKYACPRVSLTISY